MYAAFSIAQKMFFLAGVGNPHWGYLTRTFLHYDYESVLDGVAQGKYGLWTNKRDGNRPVDLHK